MVRQCAWCLHLINSAGERLSSLPVPKLYEASHGICGVCGMQWMEQVINAEEPRGMVQRPNMEASGQETITQMLLQLQERTPEAAVHTSPRRSPKLPLN
jgi:hypothetical protein